MALALTITDNANGTAAFSVTGTSGGESWTAYASIAGAAWVSVAAGTGDATPNVTLANGYYFGYVINTSATEFSPVTTRTKVMDLTNDTTAMHYQMLLATQARFQDLLLNEIDTASILVLKQIDARTLEKDRTAPMRMPGILICQGSSERIKGGTNGRDDIGYPVAVYIFAKDDKDLTANHNKYLRWREQLIHSVINQRLTGITEQFMAEVEPGPIIHDGAWLKGLLASAFTIRFTARRTRGII